MGPLKRPSRLETAVSFGILGVVIVIAWAVLLKQSRYDPATIVFYSEQRAPSEESMEPAPVLSDFFTLIPENMKPLGTREAFGPENLADKINGKAELYLSAGFIGLISQRFQLKNDPQAWMEWYVYDMGNLRQAFSVYSMQKRSGSETLTLTPFSCRTGNALFFVHGKYYIEAVASVPSMTVVDAMGAFGKRFVENVPVQEDAIEEIALFPKDGMVEDRVAFLVSDAFGFQGMDHVFTAQYQDQGQEITAFIARRNDDEDARKVVDAYRDFLISFGGKAVERETLFPRVVSIDMMGDLERFINVGRYVVGIRETDDWKVTEVLLQKLVGQLQQQGP